MGDQSGIMNGLTALHELDPAQGMKVDTAALRTLVSQKMLEQGLVFSPTPGAGSGSLQSPCTSGNVVAFKPRRANAGRNWLIGLSTVAAATVVGITGWTTVYPQITEPETPEATKPSSSETAPTLSAAGVNSAAPGAGVRLSGVGKVDFVSATKFSTTPAKAPAYKLSEGKTVSSREVQKVADTLGLKGSVEKNGSGFTVKDSSGATLTVVVGDLTSLDFNNPTAVHMVCVPVVPGDGHVELPNPKATRSPLRSPSPSAPPAVTPASPVTPANPGSVTPMSPRRIELPHHPSGLKPEVTPTETPVETVPPAVRPVMKPTQEAPEPKQVQEPSKDTKTRTGYPSRPNKENKGNTAETGEVYYRELTARSDTDSPALPSASAGETGDDPTAASTSTDAEVQSRQSPDPAPTNCVMKVAGEAPSRTEALAEVSKVANSLGATVVSAQAGVTQKDGLTTVDVPVKLPGASPQNWRAVVSANGVASIRANLGKETKLGDYRVISQQQAVERLNDPKYGPIDVFDPTGRITAKITGKIELVEAKLSNAPIKQKDGTTVSLPVYHLVDTEGRVWTVLAVVDETKK